jgi:hypothetical protein
MRARGIPAHLKISSPGTLPACQERAYPSRGNVKNPDGSLLVMNGLWPLQFGYGGASGPGSTPFLGVGPNQEKNGSFGTLTPVNRELQEDD